MLEAPYKKTKVVVISFLVLISAFFLWLQPPKAPYETIFYGGTILTLERENPTAQALLMRGEHILAVGTLEEVRAAAFSDATEINLDGRTLMPGLIEPHTHPLASAMLGETVDVSGFNNHSRAAIMHKLTQAVQKAPTDSWVMAYGWDPVMMPDLTPPTLKELDTIAPNKPLIILTQMMHDAFVNSTALEAAAITKTTPNPPGAEFVRNKNGELTGTIREVAAIEHLLMAMPPIPDGAASFLLARQYAIYARAGYTTLGILGPVGRTKSPIASLQYIAQQPETPVRTFIYALPKQLTELTDNPAVKTGPQPHATPGAVIGVKFWMDGSPFAGGAALKEPYEDTHLVRKQLHLSSDHKGTLNYQRAAFEKAFRYYHNLGYQIAVHVQGERAIKQVLDVAQRVIALSPRKDHRHRLEHNALITKRQLHRAKKLGMTVSFFADHIYFYGHALEDIVGKARVARYMPIKTAVDMGHKVTVHTDNPATPINAMRAMQSLRARATRFGNCVIGPDQKLDRHEALEAMTINAAWQLGIDDKTGSLREGKLADLLLLSANPLTTEDKDLQSIQVVSTWINGQPADTRALNPITFKTGMALLFEFIVG